VTDIFGLLDELRTIAHNGLTYTTNPYDRERYQKLLDLTIERYSEELNTPSGEVRKRLTAELGYVTPKVGSDAAIFDEQGRILLIKRADDGTYGLPGGWMDPNESPAETAAREVHEETGYFARALQLVGVFSEYPGVAQRRVHTWVSIVYLCEITGGEAQTSHETTQIGYWTIEDVPTWHNVHQQYALAAREVWLARRDQRG
jgi:ADP-ribose pyrophosphatase YjhB (NUDIX family)